MRIAFTHNLATSRDEDQAEFDSPATVAMIVGALERLGHVAHPVEVSGPLSRTIACLESVRPDLVFNIAEGLRGRVREALIPTVLDEMRIPYTGSGPHAMTLTLDKYLAKLAVARHGVRTPSAQIVFEPTDLELAQVRFPVIVKPNFEGSSKGITLDSVADDESSLRVKVESLLRRYRDGLLVEEFIEGSDVTVPFLEAVGGARDGVLAPVEYGFHGEVRRNGRTVYDYALKSERSDSVSVHAPANLTPAQAEEILEMTRSAIRALDIRDIGRLDYRVARDGTLYFLEANALPSLEPGAGLYAAAALDGLGTLEHVLETVIVSACRRWGLRSETTRGRRARGLRVGFSYNEKRIRPDDAGDNDGEAEYDCPEALQAIRDAIVSEGHFVVNLEATPELPQVLLANPVDIVFNMAEGTSGRGRESQVPALLELVGIPFTGSDAAAMAFALDKSVAKQIVSAAGVPAPRGVVLRGPDESMAAGALRFPVIVKPLSEGSSKGIVARSVVSDPAAVRSVSCAMLKKYRMPVIVEEFLPGREFTVGLLGYPEPHVLPVMEIEFLDTTNPTPVYAFEAKQHDTGTMRYPVPANLTACEHVELVRLARVAFDALGCRDIARLDFRMDAAGRFHFIECNPLPGLTPRWSDFVVMAEAAGIDYQAIIRRVVDGAIARLVRD